MINDYLILIVPALIGAIVATIVNYIYYRQTTHKENKAKFLKEQITELLLPLYFHIKDIESFYDLERNHEDYYDRLREDTKIREIATDKLYLASQKLSPFLLDFLMEQSRFQFEYQCGVHVGDYLKSQSDNFHKNYKKFRDTLYTECEEKIKEYQKYYISGFWGSVVPIFNGLKKN